jgi:copper transport protein
MVIHRSFRVAAIAFGFAGALVASARGVAYAHAMLLSSSPAAGSTQATAPTRVWLLFSEEIEPGLARVSIVDSAGHTTALKAGGDPHDVRAIVAPMTGLTTGAYRVVWRVVSADGHPVAGSFMFSVGRATPIVPRQALADSDSASAVWGPMILGAPIIPALLRGAGVGTLMAFAGLLLFLALTPTSVGVSDRDHQVVHATRSRMESVGRWIGLAALALLVAHALAWVLSASPDHRLTSDSAVAALTTGPGRVELWRVGLTALAVWAIWLARRPRIAVAFGILAVAVGGAAGHSGAIHPLWATPAKAVHLLAVAAWMGGLIWLIALASRASTGEVDAGGPTADSSYLAAEAHRVSAAALAAVVLVALTGLAQSLLFLSAPLDVVRSAYGAVLLLKIAGLGVLVAFGAHHRFRKLPLLGVDPSVPRRFSRTLRLEVLAMSIVALLGGLLAYVPPPGGTDHVSSTTNPP